MRKTKYLLALFLVVILSWGCSPLKELSKTIWGSSTRALEQAKKTALLKTFPCSVDVCFEKTLELTRPKANPNPDAPPDKPILELFLKDKKKYHLVVIGVPGSVDTTEVGIFFESVSESETLVQISSLSTNAKVKAAEIVFAHLATLNPVPSK